MKFVLKYLSQSFRLASKRQKHSQSKEVKIFFYQSCVALGAWAAPTVVVAPAASLAEFWHAIVAILFQKIFDKNVYSNIIRDLLLNETILNVRRSKLLKKGLERPNYGRYQLDNSKSGNCHKLSEIFVYNLYFHTEPYHFQRSSQQPSNRLIMRWYIGQIIIKRFIFTPTLSDETRETRRSLNSV